MLFILDKTKSLEQQLEKYLDLVSNAGILFKEGIRDYLKKKEQFQRHLEALRSLENQADKLRREIESYLYRNTLIPESRGDVLALLETTDDVINRAKDTLLEFSIESPEIPTNLHTDFLQLTEYVTQAVSHMVYSTRSFFRDPGSVKDNLHKVHFYEKEADQVSEELKRKIFKSEYDLAHQIHLRYFTFHIDLIADYAEDVADRLSIYTIKRTI